LNPYKKGLSNLNICDVAALFRSFFFVSFQIFVLIEFAATKNKRE